MEIVKGMQLVSVTYFGPHSVAEVIHACELDNEVEIKVTAWNRYARVETWEYDQLVEVIESGIIKELKPVAAKT